MTKLLGLLLPLALVAAAGADMIDLIDINGRDSGWSVYVPDPVHTGVVVDRVTDTYVRIEVNKGFWQAPENGCYEPNVLVFQQRLDDAHTVGQVQIADEVVANDTGASWSGCVWDVSGAAFDAAATDASGFSIAPFTVRSWTQAAGWGAGMASRLTVEGGAVGPGQTFTPGRPTGNLYVAAKAQPGQASFVVFQSPVPEPAALSMIALGLASVVFRSHRRSKG